jgi:hypothetical protein
MRTANGSSVEQHRGTSADGDQCCQECDTDQKADHGAERLSMGVTMDLLADEAARFTVPVAQEPAERADATLSRPAHAAQGMPQCDRPASQRRLAPSQQHDAQSNREQARSGQHHHGDARDNCDPADDAAQPSRWRVMLPCSLVLHTAYCTSLYKTGCSSSKLQEGRASSSTAMCGRSGSMRLTR